MANAWRQIADGMIYQKQAYKSGAWLNWTDTVYIDKTLDLFIKTPGGFKAYFISLKKDGILL